MPNSSTRNRTDCGEKIERLTDAELRDALMRRASRIWPVERLLVLAYGWIEGETGAALGERLGCGKNAAIGKVHRLVAFGILDERPSPIIRDPDDPRLVPRVPSPKPLAAGAAILPPLASGLEPPPVSKRLPPVALNRPLGAAPRPPVAPAKPADPAPKPRPPVPAEEPVAARAAAKPQGRITQCCWPIGDPGTRGFHFCDAPSEANRPYCPAHLKAVYVKVPRRQMVRNDGYARLVRP